jgi:hypothetical protein
MFNAAESTKERVQAYREALEQEIAGYEARITRIELGRQDPLVDGSARLTPEEAVQQIQERIRQCKAEIARVAKAPAGRRKGKPASDDDASSRDG